MSNSPSTSPLLNRWLPTILFFLAALGIPAASIAVFTHFITEHPLLAIVIGLIYEVFVFILGFLGKVWQKLESRWVDRIAEWFDHWMLSVLSRYRKQYCQYLGFQHRDFDVKGLSLQGPYTLELNQVFIELSIDPITIQQMSANPVQVLQALREGSHSIWNYLASAPLANQHLAIIGPPGSGKTTLLKHITLTLLAHRKQNRNQTRIPRKLPIMLFLRDHVNAIHASASKEIPVFALVDALHDHLKRWEQPEPPAGWVKHQLARGRCLVMLDGLDEVADPQIRREVVSWVQTQIAAYRQNRFIVTSRPFGFRSNPLSGVAVLEVRPFTSEQVEQFVQKWYLADEIMRKQKEDEGVRMRARAEAKELLKQLYNTPALLDLTVNPLLLTMIAIVHRYGGGGKLPEKRVALYADICKVFLGKRQEARGQELELKADQMHLVLQPLAYCMMKRGIRDITTADAQSVIEEPLKRVNSQIATEAFLKLVENVSGLLLERENSVYSFAHLTFQEYLTAIYIRERQLDNELVALVEHTWWQETIRLYCAMADATPIINACLTGDRPSVPALLLAYECQKEARELKPEVKARLETILNQGMEDLDPERQHIAAEVMLARRLRKMVLLKENTFVDTSFVTCGEYQLFLDEQRVQGHDYQPDHWKDYRFPSGQGHNTVLGVRSSDAAAFCAWLNEREIGSWRYRLPAAGEISSTGDESILNRLPPGTGYWLDQSNGFVWIKEALPLPSSVIQEVLWRDLASARARVRDLVSDLDLDRALDLALVRALDLASDLALVRARARALALDLAIARDRVRALDLDLAIDRVRALAGELARVRALALDLDLASDLYLALDRARDRVRALDLDLAIDRVRALAGDLYFDLDRAHDRVRDLASDLDLDLAIARDLASARDLDHDLDRALDRALNRVRDRVRALDLASDHTSALDLDRALNRSFNQALNRSFNQALNRSFNQALNRALNRASAIDRVRARITTLALALVYLNNPSIGIRYSSWRQRLLIHSGSSKLVDLIIDGYLDMYIELVILEKRVEGTLPACESILIVKERKKDSTITTPG